MNRSKPLLKREDASCGMTTAQGRYNAFKSVEELCLRVGGKSNLRGIQRRRGRRPTEALGKADVTAAAHLASLVVLKPGTSHWHACAKCPTAAVVPYIPQVSPRSVYAVIATGTMCSSAPNLPFGKRLDTDRPCCCGGCCCCCCCCCPPKPLGIPLSD